MTDTPRLPIPGSDDDKWGNLLNDFLGVEHNADGTLKKATDIADAKVKADSAVQSVNSKPGPAVTLTPADVSAEPAGLSNATKTVLSSTYVSQPTSGTTTGYVPTVQSDGTVEYAAQAGSGSSLAYQFRVEDYGAVGDGTTDDTAAINSAIAAAVTWANSNNFYAEVLFRPAVYLIGGSLTQGSATKGNAQIPLPVVGPGQPSVSLALRGASSFAAPNPYFKQTVPGVGGTTLLSTLTGQSYSATYGRPSVLGGPTAEQGYAFNGSFGSALFNNMLVVVDGIIVMTQFESGAGTMTGVDLVGTAKAHVQSLSCIANATISEFANAANKPVNFWSNGLVMPGDGNNDNAFIGSYSGFGFYRALVAGEHLTAQRIQAVYCYKGIAGDPTNGHAWTIQNASVEACQIALANQGTTGSNLFPVVIGVLDCETIGFYDGGGLHISDPENLLSGVVNVVPDFGISDVLQDGAANLTINNLKQTL